MHGSARDRARRPSLPLNTHVITPLLRPGSKLDVEALRNRARAEQFPAALQKGDSTIMCVRPGLEISESEDVTVRPLRSARREMSAARR